MLVTCALCFSGLVLSPDTNRIWKELAGFCHPLVPRTLASSHEPKSGLEGSTGLVLVEPT